MFIVWYAVSVTDSAVLTSSVGRAMSFTEKQLR
nr:MAG TPA: hypothetical protein [Caudoviricetes sp.]